MEDPDGVEGSWIQTGPALAVVVIWENETVGEISLCVSLLPSFSVTLLSKYINIKKEMFI